MSDYIKRDDVLEALEWKWAGKAAIEAVKVISAADVRPVVRGEWVDTNAVIGISTETDHVQVFAHRCSLCGELFPSYWTRNFCPNCGADMRGKDNA